MKKIISNFSFLMRSIATLIWAILLFSQTISARNTVAITPNISSNAQENVVNVASTQANCFSRIVSETNSTINAGLVPNFLASFGGYVWYDVDANGIQVTSEPGVPGVTVTLYASNGTVIATNVTDGNGYYHFSVFPGTYTVGFTTIPIGGIITLPNRGSNDARDSDINPSTGTTTIPLVAGNNNPMIDVGIIPPAVIGNYVWHDLNYNGIQDFDELPLSGVTVTLYNINGEEITSTLTDANGIYHFFVGVGTYYLVFTNPNGTHFTLLNTTNTGASIENNSDANSNGETTPFTINIGDKNFNIDAGLTTTIFPIELAAFNVTEKDCDALLTWTTHTEENARMFEIQRSSDQITYTTIATQTAKGNTTQIQHYQYRDTDAKGKLYYRLRMLDNDGRFEYSNIQSLNISCHKNSTLLYPNPIGNGLLTLEIHTELAAQNATITIIDKLGRIVSSQNSQFQQGNNVLKINVEQLAVGSYELRINAGEYNKVLRFVKVKP